VRSLAEYTSFSVELPLAPSSPPKTKGELSTATAKFWRADHVDVDATVVHVDPSSAVDMTSFRYEDPS
jgi:hypothetical protein